MPDSPKLAKKKQAWRKKTHEAADQLLKLLMEGDEMEVRMLSSLLRGKEFRVALAMLCHHLDTFIASAEKWLI